MGLIESIAVPAELRPDTVAALAAELRRVEDSPARAVVLRGACSGVALDCVADWSRADNVALWELLRGLVDSRLVTVAAVDGAVTGGGVGLAAACDMVVAGPGAELRLTELLVGLVPALIWPFVVARTGQGAAFRAAVLATRLDAAAAVRMGLADEATEPEPWLRDLARALRRMPRNAVADLKACRRFVAREDYPDHAYALLRKAAADPAVRARLAAVS
jgi:polyketide biosynthesis enoyl-CoA hydratase PksH